MSHNMPYDQHGPLETHSHEADTFGLILDIYA